MAEDFSDLFDIAEDELAAQQVVQLHLNSASCTVHELHEPEIVQALQISSEDFTFQDERALLITGTGGGAEAIAGCLKPNLKSTEFDEQDMTFVAMAVRNGFSMRGVRVAVQLRCPTGEVVLLFSNVGSAVHGAIATMMNAANGRLDAQVYRTPFGAQSVRPDTYWGTHWDGRAAVDYGVYREALDALLADVVTAQGASGQPLRIVEPCAGDGALAARLLFTAWAQSHIAAYTLSERNTSLVSKAKATLSQIPIVTVIEADAADAAAYGPAGGADVVVMAGGVLNGQVGTFAEAESALGHVAKCLAPRGVLIVSGVSISWLHPALLRRHGLSVVTGGSHATSRTQCAAAPKGVDHGWERVQCFVVRRRVPFDEPSTLFDALAGGGEAPRQAPSVEQQATLSAVNFAAKLKTRAELQKRGEQGAATRWPAPAP